MPDIFPPSLPEDNLAEDDFERHRCRAARACGPLTDAEVTILQNTLRGKPTEFQDPSKNVIRPIFIRWIIGAMPTSPEIPKVGLRIKGARIETVLNLANVEIRSPLILERCELHKGVDLRGATTGFLDFSGSTTTLIRATGLTVHGDFRLRSIFDKVNEETIVFDAKEGMFISNAKISGNLDCRGAQFGQIPKDEFKGADSQQYEEASPVIVADRIEIGGHLLCSFTKYQDYQSDFTARGGIELMNADIKGMVDFTGATIESTKILAIRADAMRVGSSVLMRDKFSAQGQVRLEYATIGGKLDLTGGKFSGPFGPEDDSTRDKGPDNDSIKRIPDRDRAAVTLDGIRITGDLSIGNEFALPPNEARNKFTCLSEFRMRGARIQGALHIENAEFHVSPEFPNGSAFSMAESVVDGRIVFCSSVMFYGNIHMPYCKIGGSLLVEARGISAAGGKNSPEFFHSENCHAICAYSLNVEGDIRFGTPDGKPSQAPETPEIRSSINLSHSRIKRSVTFRKGRYSRDEHPSQHDEHPQHAIILDGAEVGRHVEFRDGCTVLGTISMRGIRVGQNVQLTGCRFADIRETELAKNEDYISVDVANGVIAGDLKWRVPEPVGNNSNEGSLRPPGIVSFARLQARRLHDHEDTWPISDNQRSKLRLDGFHYDTIHADSANYNRKRWLELDNRGPRFSLQPYEHLYRVLRMIGREDDAREIAIAKQRAITDRLTEIRRKAGARENADAGQPRSPFKVGQLIQWVGESQPLQALAGDVTAPFHQDVSMGRMRSLALKKQLLSFFELRYRRIIDWFCRFGYAPMRPFLFLIFLVFLSADVFWIADLCGLTLPTKAHDYKASVVLTGTAPPPADYPEFLPFIYSLELAEPLMAFDQARHWDMGGTYWNLFRDPGRFIGCLPANLIKVWQYLHIFIGHMLVLVIALSPTKLLRQD